MKALVTISFSLFFAAGIAGDIHAQGWLEKVGQKAIDRARQKSEGKITEKVDQTVDKTVDGAFGAAEGAVTGKGTSGQAATEGQPTDDQSAPQAAPTPKSLESAYAKSDFVPGDELIFADDLASEQSGEFPSKWDLFDGSAEIASFQGSNSIYVDPKATILPLMKDMNAYLPDVFTIEFDILIDDPGEQWGQYEIYLYNESFESHGYICAVTFGLYGGQGLDWTYKAPGNPEPRRGELDTGPLLRKREWNHVAISFNKRAFKLYFNGERRINIPSMEAPKRIALRYGCHGTHKPEQPFAIKDFRICQGAVPLYDRMLTDGKIVTYGITFDVGKSTLKPESMTEINRIAQLMKDNPSLKFSVEGHTDATGNATLNQTLSDARSKAVVDKLVELGVTADRLQAAGKGQNNPIADNNTDEGRAKNRRVEFVKL